MNKEMLLDKEIEFLQLQLQLYPGKFTRSQNVAQDLRARLNQLHRIKQSKLYQTYEPAPAAYDRSPNRSPAQFTPSAIPTPAVVQPTQSRPAVARLNAHSFALTMKIALGIYLGFLLSLVTYIVLFNAGMFPNTP